MSKPGSIILTSLLISALVFLSFSQGLGRRIHVMRHYGTMQPDEEMANKKGTIEREMVEMKMDYGPGANTDTKDGAVFSSHVTTPPPHPVH